MARKRPPAGTVAAAVDAAQQIAAGYPEPPKSVEMREQDRPFWEAVLRARLPQEWARIDLVHAAQLARTMSDIEENRALLLVEGDMVSNAKNGSTKLNPRHALLEVLSRRSMSLTRILQLHAVVKFGQASKVAGSKAEAETAAATFEQHPDDDLLARPMMQ